MTDRRVTEQDAAPPEYAPDRPDAAADATRVQPAASRPDGGREVIGDEFAPKLSDFADERAGQQGRPDADGPAGSTADRPTEGESGVERRADLAGDRLTRGEPAAGALADQPADGTDRTPRQGQESTESSGSTAIGERSGSDSAGSTATAERPASEWAERDRPVGAADAERPSADDGSSRVTATEARPAEVDDNRLRADTEPRPVSDGVTEAPPAEVTDPRIDEADGHGAAAGADRPAVPLAGASAAAAGSPWRGGGDGKPDSDATQAMDGAAADPAERPRADDAIFRNQQPDSTAVMPAAVPSEEERKLAAERAARREAREQALAAPDSQAARAAEPVIVTQRSTDKFFGGLGLFLVRLVVAAILAVRGLEIVTNLPAAEAFFATTMIPEPRIMALVAGVGALAIAVALVFGLLTRLAGLGVALIGIGALVFVQWGNWSPFVQGRSGFVGELELLLAVVGLLLLLVGGGGFSLDRSFRKSRERDRLADQGL